MQGGENTCEITGRQRKSDADGKGLEVPCVHTSFGKPRNCLSYYLWRRLQTARTSCLPFNRLCSKPQSQDFSKCHTTGRCPFPRNRISCFQSHNNHKRVLKCHLRWRSCRVPRIVFYWLLRSQDFLKCHADFSKCHTVADDATSWIHRNIRKRISTTKLDLLL